MKVKRKDLWDRVGQMGWTLERRPGRNGCYYREDRCNHFRLTSPGKIVWDDISIRTAHRILDGLRPPNVMGHEVRLVRIALADIARLQKIEGTRLDYVIEEAVRLGLKVLEKEGYLERRPVGTK